MLPGFKTAPTKFAKELADNGADDPEPAFLRQFIAGDRALRNRRRGELYRAGAIGSIVAVLGVALPALFAPFWLAVLLISTVGGASVSLFGLSLWLLWDAKMSDVESRALVAEGDMKVRILSDEEIEEMEQRKQRGLEMHRKAS